jgi:hypothetical protein
VSDEMMLDIAKMSYELAMQDELSRHQFYVNTQRLVAALHAARAEAEAWKSLASTQASLQDELTARLSTTMSLAAEVKALRAEVDAVVKATQAPRACTCHPDDRPNGPCRERYAASECQALAAVDEAMVERIAALLYEEASDDPWTIAGVEQPGPDRDYYRGLASKVAALVGPTRSMQRVQHDEALLRQALEALELGAWDTRKNAAAAIRERLEGSKT